MDNIQEQIIQCKKEIKQLEDKIYLLILDECDQKEINRLEAEKKNKKSELNKLENKVRLEEKEKAKSKPQENNKIYEPFHDKKLNGNQMVIEIHKAGEWHYEKGEKIFREDFSVYNDLVFGLMRLGEKSLCLYALMRYLNDNKHNFNYVLWFQNFSNLTSFKESAYRYALKALFYYKILEPTNRYKKNDSGVCCRVFIFHSDLLVKDLPDVPFDKNNKKHLEIAAANKALCD